MKTIFVDVDTQFDFIMPDGNLHVPGADKLIPNFTKLMQLAVDRKIRILSCADAHTQDDPEFDIFPPHCVKGLPGWEKIPETMLEDRCYIGDHLEKDNGISNTQQIILEKTAFSFFDNRNAEAVLRYLNPDVAVVFGVATDYCVKEAALGLMDMGYQAYVVTDAIAPVDPEKGKIALKEMELAGVKFIKTDEVEALLEKVQKVK